MNQSVEVANDFAKIENHSASVVKECITPCRWSAVLKGEQVKRI